MAGSETLHLLVGRRATIGDNASCEEELMLLFTPDFAKVRAKTEREESNDNLLGVNTYLSTYLSTTSLQLKMPSSKNPPPPPQWAIDINAPPINKSKIATQIPDPPGYTAAASGSKVSL